MKKILVTILTAALLLSSATALASSAPYMVATILDWDGQTYDIIEGQFKCVDAVTCTYYAMHNWYNDSGDYSGAIDGAGYAGFQYNEGKTWTIMSIWHGQTGRAKIEYAPDNAIAEPFDGEGVGVHVLVPYSWQPGTWYTMRIEAITEGGKTYYVQWVKPENGSWTKTAVISFSKPNLGFTWDCFFLEDWIGNGLQRSCQLRRYYARRAGDSRWVSLRDYRFSCADPKAIHYSFCQTDEGTVYIQSGGEGFPVTEVPATLTVLQPTDPGSRYNLGR